MKETKLFARDSFNLFFRKREQRVYLGAFIQCSWDTRKIVQLGYYKNAGTN